MKFARYIETLQLDCPQEWKGKFIRYKELKKVLKRAGDGDDGVDAGRETEFFGRLEQQMAKVNRHFQSQADHIISSYRHSQRRITLCCFLALRGKSSREREAALAQQAYWCRKYAKANAVALRKILKKHDKLCGNMRGRLYLQQCWRSNGIGLFLHSPLLDELKAIQDHLDAKEMQALQQQQQQGMDMELCEPAPAAGTAAAKRAALAAASYPSSAFSSRASSPEALKQQQQGATAAAVVIATAGAGEAAPAPPPPGSFVPGSELLAGQGRAGAPQACHISASAASVGPLGSSPSALSSPLDSGPASLQRLSATTATSSADGSTSQATSSALGLALSPSSLVSFRRQAHQNLESITESPNCLLDSSDIEWEATGLPMSQRCQGALPSDLPGANSLGAGREDSAHHVECASSGGGGASGAGVGAGQALAVTGVSRFSERDLRCPICLDAMYQPVGLGCGHKFCRPCALEHAHMQWAYGTFHNLCLNVKPQHDTCPQCRQAGVYAKAVQLKQLGQLCKSRFPKEWAERDSEEAGRKKAVKQQLKKQMQVRQVASAYELLF